MSGSYYTLNAKYNSLLSLINGFFPYPPSPYPPPTDVMTLSTAQTASGLKTFSTLPQSAVVPTNADDLVNKTYADSLFPTPVNAVTIDGSQTLGTGIKTFTNLPECSALPTTGSQLVNKTYVDGLTPATPTITQVLTANNNALDVSQIFSDTGSTTQTTITNTSNTITNGAGGSVALTPKDIVVADGANVVSISSGGAYPFGVNIKGTPVMPIYTNWIDTDTYIPAYDAVPHQINIYSKGRNPTLNFVLNNIATFTQPVNITCFIEYNGTLFAGDTNGAVWNYDGGSGWYVRWTCNGAIRTMKVNANNGNLYIGGDFSVNYNVGTCNYIFAVDTGFNAYSLTWNNYSMDTGFNGNVYALESAGNYMFVGGAFTQTGNNAKQVSYFAVFDTTSFPINTPTIYSIDDNYISNGGFNAPVRTISYVGYGANVFIGGDFNQEISSASGYYTTDYNTNGVIWYWGQSNAYSLYPAFDYIGSSPTALNNSVYTSAYNANSGNFVIGGAFNCDGIPYITQFPNYSSHSIQPVFGGASNPVSSIYYSYYANWLFFGTIYGDCYEQGFLVGNAGYYINAIYFPQNGSLAYKTLYAFNDNGTYGFYYWTNNQAVNCYMPSSRPNTLLWYGNGSYNGVNLPAKGACLSVIWDGTNYWTYIGNYNASPI